MIYRGRVENGVVKFLGQTEPPEGAEVDVSIRSTEKQSGSLHQILNSNTKWVEGYPGEFDDLLRLVQADRDQDIELQKRADAGRLLDLD